MTPKQREKLKERILPIVEGCIILKPSIAEPDTAEKFTDIIIQEVEKDFLIKELKYSREVEKVQ